MAATIGHGTAVASSGRKLPNAAIIAIGGMTEESDPARLAMFVEPFLIREIPVMLTVSPHDPSGKPFDRDCAMAQWLRKTMQSNSGKVEVGIHLESIVSQDPYFQLRQASEAQAVFCFALNEYSHYRRHAIFAAQTITTWSDVDSDLAALRAAGIRTAICLPQTAEARPEYGYYLARQGLAKLVSSPLTSARSAKDFASFAHGLSANVKAQAAGVDPAVVDIPADLLAGLGASELEKHATDIAEQVREASLAGAIRPILPGKLYRQSRNGPGRYVVIRIDDLRLNPAADARQMKFVQDLADADFPVTEAVVPAAPAATLTQDLRTRQYLEAMLARPGYDLATHGWRHAPSEVKGKSESEALDIVRNGISEVYRATGRFPTSYIPPNNAFDANTIRALAATGTPMLGAEQGDFSWFTGLDSSGVLHVSNTVMFEKNWNEDIEYFETREILDLIGDENDAVFCIHLNTANTAEKTRRLFDTLEALSSQDGTSLVNFEEYYHAVMPAAPAFERIRQARSEVSIRDWRPESSMSRNRQALKEDARLAWTYFEWGAENFDGLVPATTWMEAGGQKGYPFATMWDIASYIMASISAHRIGLLDEAGFEAKVTRILGFLGEETYSYRGVALPPAERSLGNAGTSRRGFDSADTGRLLIALKILDSYSEGSFDISRLVSRWSFDPVLAGGEMHIVGGGRKHSKHDNSYANYVGQGYELWGYRIKPVFDSADPGRNMDEAVATLAEIARRGRIATEPHTTEEIELGGTPHGRLMADTLLAAQIKRHADTGVLTCVSEGPVAEPPYFTYQGYQVNEQGGEFVVDAPSRSGIAAVAKKADRLRAVSSKGAYLWHAVRPGDYSDRLVELVQNQARLPGMGFSSGVSERTGEPFELSDVNTNGLILEAIAYILGGREPFLAPASS